ncbi:hypothetical protein EC973_006704 [Apophysomyces ossiformis]|uniref:Glucosidase 2 subunit beta n=1 Tax=Apophysomyces ossiformis TaxID=679940 RepID=A0A8H7BUX2_9FUNG|nr:hypothetical protein EC973_006704 [Apophysomyces ossiformis]
MLHSMYVPTQGNWKCLDGSRSIAFSAINDDYCDCPDGSDEPGTSACPNSHFYCRNEGHIPAYIKSYAVNDGVCDEACCDGSDEAQGLCPNRCKEVAAEYAKTQAKLHQIRSTGVKAKRKLIDEAKEVIEGWIQEKAKLEDELSIKRAELEQHKRALDELETREKGNQARTSACKSCQKEKSQISKLRSQVMELQDDVDLLLSLLHDLKRDHNHNYHDMAVKAAISGYDEFVQERDTTKKSFENEDDVEEDFAADEEADETNVQPASEGKAEFSFLNKLTSALPSQLKDWLDLLPTKDKDNQEFDSSELESARKVYDELKSDIENKENKLKDVTDELANDYGTENEWLKLKDVCVEKDEGEYTYSLCVLGHAYQKSNKDGMRTNLGRFESFGDDYHKHTHTHGTRCWNGPERSVQAFFECGGETEILEVTEPEKCEYHFRMRSPALCEMELEKGQPKPAHVHEEL